MFLLMVGNGPLLCQSTAGRLRTASDHVCPFLSKFFSDLKEDRCRVSQTLVSPLLRCLVSIPPPSLCCFFAASGSLSLLPHVPAGVAVSLMPLATRRVVAEAGVLGRRGFALESATARVCREAGTRVTTNVLVKELDLLPMDRVDARLEVVADGLPLPLRTGCLGHNTRLTLAGGLLRRSHSFSSWPKPRRAICLAAFFGPTRSWRGCGGGARFSCVPVRGLLFSLFGKARHSGARQHHTIF